MKAGRVQHATYVSAIVDVRLTGTATMERATVDKDGTAAIARSVYAQIIIICF